MSFVCFLLSVCVFSLLLFGVVIHSLGDFKAGPTRQGPVVKDLDDLPEAQTAFITSASPERSP